MDVPNTTKYIAFDPSPGVAPLFVSGDLLCLSARASEKGDASASQPGGPIFYLNKGHNPHKRHYTGTDWFRGTWIWEIVLIKTDTVSN